MNFIFIWSLFGNTVAKLTIFKGLQNLHVYNTCQKKIFFYEEFFYKELFFGFLKQLASANEII